MDTPTLAYVFFAFAAAAFQKGITGLGFSTVCLGLLAAAIDPKVAIGLVLVPSLVSNAIVMVEAGGFLAAARRFWPLYVSLVPGLLVGLAALERLDADPVRATLGAVMLAYAVWALWSEGRAPLDLRARERALGAPVGFLNGVVNGATGSQVMPVMPYLLALRLDKDLFVQAINTCFTVSSLIMVAGLARLGVVGGESLMVGLAGIIPVALGIRLGGKARRRIPDAAFRRIVLVLLAFLGVGLIAR